MRRLGLSHADALFENFNAKRGQVVETLAHRLEHYETERYAHRGVEHAEHFSEGRLRRAVSVADRGNHRQAEVECTSELPNNENMMFNELFCSRSLFLHDLYGFFMIF